MCVHGVDVRFAVSGSRSSHQTNWHAIGVRGCDRGVCGTATLYEAARCTRPITRLPVAQCMSWEVSAMVCVPVIAMVLEREW